MLSHWPHVATHVATQVAELVAELVFAMYFNGTVHTGHMLRRIFDTVSFNQSENGIPNDVTAATEL